MANKFSKALKHIKKDLNEVAPTNSMSGVYAINPPGFELGPPSPSKRFLPDVDGNFPAGIPGNAGDPYYERPAGHYVGDKDWDTITKPDFRNNQLGADGNNTDSLFDGTTVLANLPPNSRSYILGPLVDGFVYNHGYDAYTRIGYIDKATRGFVMLGYIRGQWSQNHVFESTGKYDNSNNTYNFPIWDGTSTGFNTYGSLTLADAQWMRTEILAGRYFKNTLYRASGGIGQGVASPSSDPPEGWPDNQAWPPPGWYYGGAGVGAGSGDAGSGGPGEGYGVGGDPDVGTGQGEPGKGDSEDAGFWGPLWGNIKDKLKDIGDKAKDIFDDIYEKGNKWGADYVEAFDDVFDDFKENVWKPNKEKFNEFFTEKIPEFAEELFDRSTELLGNLTGNTAAEQAMDNYNDFVNDPRIDPSNRKPELIDNGVDEPYLRDVVQVPPEVEGSKENPIDFTKNLTEKDKTAIEDAFKGDSLNAKFLKSKVDAYNKALERGDTDLANRLKEDIADALQECAADASRANFSLKNSMGSFDKRGTLPVGGERPMDNVDVDAYLNDGTISINKNYDFEPGGSVSYAETSEERGMVWARAIADKLNLPLDTWGSSNLPRPLGFFAAIAPAIIAKTKMGDSYDRYEGYGEPPIYAQPPMHWNITLPGDSSNNQSSSNIDGQQISTVPSGPNSPLPAPGWTPRPGSNFRPGAIWNPPKPGGGTGTYGTSIKLAHRKLEGEFLSEQKNHEPKRSGVSLEHVGFGARKLSKAGYDDILRRYRNTSKGKKRKPSTGGDLNPDNQISTSDEPWGKLEPRTESTILSESRSRILREIKKPVEVREEAPKKLKGYRPNFKGRNRPQNTPDVTASKKSDELVKATNTLGQAWRTSDKEFKTFESQSTLNFIRDAHGHGDLAWQQIIHDSAQKNGWRSREIQEQLNKIAHLKGLKEQGFDIQETEQWEREDNFDRVTKLKSIIGNLKTWQGDIKPEYPDEKPPKMEKGFHPKLGKDKFNYYKRLDSVSARAMPKTGDPEIDATVDKQKKKKMVQPKVVEDTRSNWRDSLTNA